MIEYLPSEILTLIVDYFLPQQRLLVLTKISHKWNDEIQILRRRTAYHDRNIFESLYPGYKINENLLSVMGGYPKLAIIPFFNKEVVNHNNLGSNYDNLVVPFPIVRIIDKYSRSYIILRLKFINSEGKFINSEGKFINSEGKFINSEGKDFNFLEILYQRYTIGNSIWTSSTYPLSISPFIFKDGTKLNESILGELMENRKVDINSGKYQGILYLD